MFFFRFSFCDENALRKETVVVRVGLGHFSTVKILALDLDKLVVDCYGVVEFSALVRISVKM